jgi:hypothetical protein
MKTARFIAVGLLAVAATAVASGGASAQSFGFYSMPSRVSQYLGYGYGAGHHAPIVKTPGQHPVRVPRHVKAPAACGPLYAAPVAPIGCNGESCYPAAVQNYAPGPFMAPEPAVAPVEDRHAWRLPAR